MITSVLVLLLLLLLLTSSAWAVDRNKFRTCTQTRFCTRITESPPQVWAVNPVTVQTDQTQGRLQAQISNGNTTMELTVQTLVNNVVHFTIDELESSLYKRHRVKDVIQSDGLQPVSINRVMKGSSRIVLVVDDALTVYIKLNPFRIQVQYNGVIRIEANADDLLRFEAYRKLNLKPSNESDVDPNVQYDDPKDWKDSFGGHTDSCPKGPSAFSLDVNFPLASDLYGLPEHAASLSLPDTLNEARERISDPFRLFALDVFEYVLNDTMALYGAVPFVITNGKDGSDGILWLNAAETFVDIFSANNGRSTKWISESGIIDVFMFVGPKPSSIFHSYAVLTGMPALPPRFSLGYHQCRWNYQDEADVFSVDRGFDQHSIPYDVLWLDIEHTDEKKYFTFDPVKFPSPITMQLDLYNRTRRMVTIVDPHIKHDNNYWVYSEAESNKYFVMDSEGKSSYKGWCWSGDSSWIDYTNPEARLFWQNQFKFDKYQGSTDYMFLWNDMNEPSVFNGPEGTLPKDCLHASGVEHRDVHNQYGFYNQMASFQGLLSRYENGQARPGASNRPFLLSRSFFAGSQRYGAIWTGDNEASWGHLEASLPMLMSISLAGISNAGADVGGFFKDPDSELMIRWYQAGAFQPFFRGHAHIHTRRREPWLFGQESTDIIRQSLRDRYSFLPYIYTEFRNNTVTGMPVMRPIWVEFNDSKFSSISDHYMLGNSLLVRPITTANTRDCMVSFPGTSDTYWYDIITFVAFHGGQTLSVPAPLNKIPVYQRGGTIIPRLMRPRRSSECQTKFDPYSIYVALDSTHSAEGTLYTDDGLTYNFQQGSYSMSGFRFQGNTFKSFKIHSSDFEVTNPVERIVILGLTDSMKSAVLYKDGKLTPVEFVQQFNPDIVTVRKPDVRVADDFEIRFTPLS